MGLDGSQPETELLAEVNKSVGIDELNRWHPVANGFAARFGRESAGGYHDPRIRLPRHCALKVSYLGRRDVAHIPLALKQHSYTQQTVDLEHTNTIDALIARAAGNRDLLETTLTKESLAEALELGRGQAADSVEELNLVV